jgi:phage-related holin
MSARQKLNAAFLNGSLIVAAVVGWLFGSWAVFALILVLLVVGNLVAGEIRPGRRRKD